MNKRDLALMAAGALTGASVSFIVVHSHYTKVLNEEFDIVREEAFEAGKREGHKEASVEVTSCEPVVEEAHEETDIREATPEEDQDEAYLNYVNSLGVTDPDVIEEVVNFEKLDAIAEDVEYQETDMEIEPPEDFEIRSASDFDRIQGYSKSYFVYDQYNGILYDQEDGSIESKYLPELIEKYGLEKWPLSEFEDVKFTLIDNVHDVEALITVPVGEVDPGDLG